MRATSHLNQRRSLLRLALCLTVAGITGLACGTERAIEDHADSLPSTSDGGKNAIQPRNDGAPAVTPGMVTVTTDKSAYSTTEPITIVISNGTSSDIYPEICHPLHPEYLEAQTWTEGPLWICKRGGYAADTVIKAGATATDKSFAMRLDANGNTYSVLGPGTWRFRLDYGLCTTTGSEFSCGDVKTVYSNVIKIQSPSSDPCALSKDIILESEKGNYNCDGIPGCEWKTLGGKLEMHYACCPKGFSATAYPSDSPIYQRCAVIVD